jgi:hypothetical protein
MENISIIIYYSFYNLLRGAPPFSPLMFDGRLPTGAATTSGLSGGKWPKDESVVAPGFAGRHSANIYGTTFRWTGRLAGGKERLNSALFCGSLPPESDW